VSAKDIEWITIPPGLWGLQGLEGLQNGSGSSFEPIRFHLLHEVQEQLDCFLHLIIGGCQGSNVVYACPQRTDFGDFRDFALSRCTARPRGDFGSEVTFCDR